VSACPVHPHATGGEIKTIGLLPVSGMTDAQVYSRWALKSGRECVCRPESVLVQAYDSETGEKVGEPYEAKLVETTPRYTAKIESVTLP
jgi:hypothetical protein